MAYVPRLTSCEGKVRFSGRRRAEQVAKRMRQNYEELILAYRCRFCGDYHVGRGLPTSSRSRRLKEADYDDRLTEGDEFDG